ncbi:hypothetical protein ACKC4V_22530, partial [Aeromonas veronii]
DWMADYRARLKREGSLDAERARRMEGINPKYVLRNALAQRAIDAAEAGDMAPFERLFEVLRHPFDEQPEADDLATPAPD